jgi:hypothetical protein
MSRLFIEVSVDDWFYAKSRSTHTICPAAAADVWEINSSLLDQNE